MTVYLAHDSLALEQFGDSACFDIIGHRKLDRRFSSDADIPGRRQLH
jgi:hypothetical protein